MYFLLCMLTGHAFYRGLLLDVWGSRIKRLVRDVLQKPAFHIYWDSSDFGIIFTCFLMALWPIFMTFGALETCLKLHDFQWLAAGGQG